MGKWELKCANKGRIVMSGHMGMTMCTQEKDSYEWAHGNQTVQTREGQL